MLTPPRRVTILGASGFLGGSIARYLAGQGHHVRVCFRGKTAAGIKRQATVDQSGFADVLVGDSHDRDFLQQAIADADVVFDFASSTKPATNFQNPGREHNTTVLPLLDLLECMVAQNVKKLVYPSSAGTVYGECHQPCREDAPLSPQTPYALCKIKCEEKIQTYVADGRISAEVVRISNVYGPGQRATKGSGVIAHWSHAFVHGTNLQVIGDQRYRRDYLFIEDLCQLLECTLRDLSFSQIVNVASGKSLSILELFDAFQKAVGEKVAADFQPSRLTDNTNVELDCSQLLAYVGGHDFVPLEQGIARTLDWHRTFAVGRH
jgi:UDP-glucose 4-epimerase